MGGGAARAALFGGTFDPFHHGHLRMAIEVAEALDVARTILVPARLPPHKPGRPVSAPGHRLAMTRAGAEGIPGGSVSDWELAREGPSYTLDTILQFRRVEPDTDWLFLMGADSFAEVATWHRYRELLGACDFVLLPRPGQPGLPPSPEGVRIEKEESVCYRFRGATYRLPGGRRLFCPALPTLDISSSAIRDKVRAGKSIRGLVPPGVEEYIGRHGLYREPGEVGRP